MLGRQPENQCQDMRNSVGIMKRKHTEHVMKANEMVIKVNLVFLYYSFIILEFIFAFFMIIFMSDVL